jgi:hypothetical protein
MTPFWHLLEGYLIRVVRLFRAFRSPFSICRVEELVLTSSEVTIFPRHIPLFEKKPGRIRVEEPMVSRRVVEGSSCGPAPTRLVAERFISIKGLTPMLPPAAEKALGNRNASSESVVGDRRVTPNEAPAKPVLSGEVM